MNGYYQTKRKVFISYHHHGDQPYYDHFTKTFGDAYDAFYDNSLERALDSDNTDYINQKIREEYIWGSSITIVLCGANTGKRKYVDWEIRSTLEYEHALLGIALPTITTSGSSLLVPDRLADNWQSGFAHWLSPYPQNPTQLQNAIEQAIQKSSNKSLIRNDREKMKRNLP